MAYSRIVSPYYAQWQPWPYIKGPNYTRPVFRENREGSFIFNPTVVMPALQGLSGGGHHGGHHGGHGGHHGGGYGGHHGGGYGGGFRRSFDYGYSAAPWWWDAPYGGFLETTVVDCGPNCTWDGYTCFCPQKKAASGFGQTPEADCAYLQSGGQQVVDKCVEVTKAWNSASSTAEMDKLTAAQNAASAKCASVTDNLANMICFYKNLDLSAATERWYTNPIAIGAMVLGGMIVAGLVLRSSQDGRSR